MRDSSVNNQSEALLHALLDQLAATSYLPQTTPRLHQAYRQTVSRWPVAYWSPLYRHVQTRDVSNPAYYERLKPWRKGPIHAGPVSINAEWDCRFKCDRLQPLLPQLRDKCVLDIGSNNGYFARYFSQAGARRVIGLEPTCLYTLQFLAQQYYQADPRITTVPLDLMQLGCLPPDIIPADVIVCMGVLYHMRYYQPALMRLYRQLRVGGALWLETFTIHNRHSDSYPTGPFAGIRGIHYVPTLDSLLYLLKSTGFGSISVLNTSITTAYEQRETPWCFKSYQGYLGHAVTAEGYPTPRRTLICAYKVR